MPGEPPPLSLPNKCVKHLKACALSVSSPTAGNPGCHPEVLYPIPLSLPAINHTSSEMQKDATTTAELQTDYTNSH